MTAKQYLSQLHEMDMKIDQDISELADLRSKSTSIGSFDYSQDRVQTSPEGEAQYVKLVEKIADKQNKINAEIDALVDQKEVIISQIRGLDNPVHSDLLYKRYVEFKDFSTIATEMDYVYSYARHLHGEALEDFETTYTNIH